jgi:putative Holliday junction resolvase
MGVDFGFKKIGIAVGETEFQIAQPRSPLHASGSLKVDAQQLAEVAKREEVEVVVVGVPVEESGIEGRMARICRTLGSHLQTLGVRVEFVDESYTSLEASARMAENTKPLGKSSAQRSNRSPTNPGQFRKSVHGEAAVLILERFRG